MSKPRTCTPKRKRCCLLTGGVTSLRYLARTGWERASACFWEWGKWWLSVLLQWFWISLVVITWENWIRRGLFSFPFFPCHHSISPLGASASECEALNLLLRSKACATGFWNFWSVSLWVEPTCGGEERLQPTTSLFQAGFLRKKASVIGLYWLLCPSLFGTHQSIWTMFSRGVSSSKTWSSDFHENHCLVLE